MKNKNNINEEEIAVQELIIFLQYDLKLSPIRWKHFCLRYGGKDISTVIAYCKNHCDTKITPKIARILESELKEEAERIKQEKKNM